MRIQGAKAGISREQGWDGLVSEKCLKALRDRGVESTWIVEVPMKAVLAQDLSRHVEKLASNLLHGKSETDHEAVESPFFEAYCVTEPHCCPGSGSKPKAGDDYQPTIVFEKAFECSSGFWSFDPQPCPKSQTFWLSARVCENRWSWLRKWRNWRQGSYSRAGEALVEMLFFQTNNVLFFLLHPYFCNVFELLGSCGVLKFWLWHSTWQAELRREKDRAQKDHQAWRFGERLWRDDYVSKRSNP